MPSVGSTLWPPVKDPKAGRTSTDGSATKQRSASRSPLGLRIETVGWRWPATVNSSRLEAVTWVAGSCTK